MTRQYSLRFTVFLLVSDLALVCLTLLLATRLRTMLWLGKNADPTTWTMPLPVYLLGIIVWGTTFVSLNLYSPRQSVRLGVELLRVAGGTLFAWMVLAGLLYFTYRDVSRLEYVYFLFFYVVLIVTHRSVLRAWFWLRGGRRYSVRQVLIVGTGSIAQEIARGIREQTWMGLSLAGFVSRDTAAESQEDVRVLGKMDDLPDLVARYDVAEVVIALSRQETEGMGPFIFRLQALPVNIRLIPDYFDMAFLRVDIEDFSGMPMLSLKEPVLDPFQRTVKRVFDVVVTVVLLIPALPVMGVVAALVRLDSPGPALFKQRRIGEGGQPFTMFKFRTMRDGAEEEQQQAIAPDDPEPIAHKRQDDPRVTRVGHWLRRTSLDELPQFFNILRGQMSLVGPRPEMPWLVDRYEEWQRKRFEVPQGLTGWWQVNGRSDRPMHLHTEDDLYYIRNYSVWLDLKIMWMTVQAVFQRRGAF